MDRFKSIAHRGWLRRFLTVATFGYFPAQEYTAIGKVCAAIGMTIPGAAWTLTAPGATLMMTVPGANTTMSAPSAAVALTAPGALIELEDCT